MTDPIVTPEGKVLALCIHELTADFCSICKEKGRPKARRERAWTQAADGNAPFSSATGAAGTLIEAQFEGNCAWCHDDIDPGDLIGNRLDQWVCGGCADAFDNHPSNG